MEVESIVVAERREIASEQFRGVAAGSLLLFQSDLE